MLYYLWTRLLGLIWFIPNMTFRFEFSFSVLSFFFGFDFLRYGIFSSFRKREWIKLKRKNWIELKTVFFLVFGWAPFLGGFSQKLFSEMVCQTWFVSAFVLSGFENKKQVLETMPTPLLQHSLSIFFQLLFPSCFCVFPFLRAIIYILSFQIIVYIFPQPLVVSVLYLLIIIVSTNSFPFPESVRGFQVVNLSLLSWTNFFICIRPETCENP